jgi:LacI family transcriptional regulator
LQDVAKRANVSTATVSRCLNTPDLVQKATRDRVLEAVKELGYAPNFGAQALAGKRTNTFGAIIPTMENAIFARGLQAFQEELGRHGVTLLAASSSYSPELEESQIRTLVARGADALLLIGLDRDPEIYRFLDRRNIPYVAAWAYEAAGQHFSIGFDNRKAMEKLAAEVLGLGHRDLALISAATAQNDRARGRMLGIQDAMQDMGFDPRTLRVVETPYSIENGAMAFEELMREAKPTAILCGNDVLAAGALRQAANMGIDVPGEVSITGFDDIELAAIVTPALTTIHVPHREMGRRSAQALIALRNGKPAGPSIELGADIKWRSTLGPANR